MAKINILYTVTILYRLCLLLLTGLTIGCTTGKTVYLGDTPLKIVQYGNGSPTIVHLHANEKTALLAAKEFIKHHEGTLITLVHQDRRNVSFTLDGKHYEFDPNRIFTPRGIKKTLSMYGPYSPKAYQVVAALADDITKRIPKDKPVIAVHNNQGYCLRDYFPRHPLAQDAQALYFTNTISLRNFYFVTQAPMFTRLKRLHQNVALQSRKAQDDGSLSYYLAKHDYINIEAAHGNLIGQLAMLNQVT